MRIAAGTLAIMTAPTNWNEGINIGSRSVFPAVTVVVVPNANHSTCSVGERFHSTLSAHCVIYTNNDLCFLCG